MGVEKKLLHSLPKSNRNLHSREKTKTREVVKISQNFGYEYFDGDRKYGYGGYYYDGRWQSVAETLIQEYNLTPSMKVLDVGCAKGFLVKDLISALPGLQVFGIDVSNYALMNCEPEVVGRLHLGNAKFLPFPNHSFDLVVSINTIHNLVRKDVKVALGEIQRVAKHSSYVVVDSYRNEFEKSIFDRWVLTAKFHGYPDDWKELFMEVGYTGDYSWTIINTDGDNE